jgi:hypothetical protein
MERGVFALQLRNLSINKSYNSKIIGAVLTTLKNAPKCWRAQTQLYPFSIKKPLVEIEETGGVGGGTPHPHPLKDHIKLASGPAKAEPLAQRKEER